MRDKARCHPVPSGQSGLSLIELMIVLAIGGILVAITYPAYTHSIHKARRSEAIAALSSLQHAQERYRTNNTAYADSLDALPAPKPASPTTPGAYYTLAVSDASATGYTVTATVTAAGNQNKDRACTSLSVAMNSGTLTYGHVGTAAEARTCWRQ